MKLINYSILAGQISIYFWIFDSFRWVTTKIWFWYILLNCITPDETIKLSKCAKSVSWKWFIFTFQKCFHEKEANVAIEKFVRIQKNYTCMEQRLSSISSWDSNYPNASRWLQKAVQTCASHKWLEFWFRIPKPAFAFKL
jgi:hypothetical protein